MKEEHKKQIINNLKQFIPKDRISVIHRPSKDIKLRMKISKTQEDLNIHSSVVKADYDEPISEISSEIDPIGMELDAQYTYSITD